MNQTIEHIVDPSLDQIADYKIEELLGSGFFGETRIGISDKTGQKVAIKVEKLCRKNANQHLASEKRIYDIIHNKQKQAGFPMIYSYGTDPRGFNYMAMELLGPSLEHLRIKYGGYFSNWTVLHIAMASLRRIEKVHSCNILYRDIKPDNFCIGFDDPTVIYLVDFGISRELLLPDGSHYPYTFIGSFFGTSRYMSVNANECHEQSRRDDLESLAYMYIFLVKGHLPWQGIRGESTEKKFVQVGQLKRQTSPASLCEGISDVYKRFLEYTKGLGYEDEPSYDTCYSMFEAEAQSLEANLTDESDRQLDWLKAPPNATMNQRLSENNSENFLSIINQPSTASRASFQVHAGESDLLVSDQQMNMNSIFLDNSDSTSFRRNDNSKQISTNDTTRTIENASTTRSPKVTMLLQPPTLNELSGIGSVSDSNSESHRREAHSFCQRLKSGETPCLREPARKLSSSSSANLSPSGNKTGPNTQSFVYTGVRSVENANSTTTSTGTRLKKSLKNLVSSIKQQLTRRK